MDNQEPKLTIEDCYGKKFIYENNRIDFSDKGKIPETLFKYYALSENSVNALTNVVEPYFYFTHPYQFNDIVDSSFLLWDMEGFSCKDFITIYNGLPIASKVLLKAQYEDDKQNGFKKLESILSSRFRNNCNYEESYWVFQIFNDLQFTTLGRYFFDLFSEKWGVLCLSEKHDNNLMWAHYAQEKGFCVEYKTMELLGHFNNESYAKICPVVYQDKLERISFNDYYKIEKTDSSAIKVDLNIPFHYLFTVKDAAWSYEKEWRVLLQKSEMGSEKNMLDFSSESIINHKARSICYPKSSINRIILGTHFFNSGLFQQEFLGNTIKYTFIKTEDCNKIKEVERMKKLLAKLLNSYNEKLFQIEHYVNTKNELERKISYKITILSIDENSVVISMNLLNII